MFQWGPYKAKMMRSFNKVQTLVKRNHYVTVQELTDEVGKSIGSVHTILSEELSLLNVSMKLCRNS